MKKTNLIPLLLVLIFFPLFKADAFSLIYDEPKEESSEVIISVDRENIPLEAIEGVIVFDSEAFELVDISLNDSGIKTWMTVPHLIEPGKISFSGVFNTETREDILFGLFFDKLENSNLKLSLDSGVILAEGDILYTLEDIVSTKVSLFNVTSSSHPDSNTWYSNDKVELSWVLPEDAQKVKILVDENERAYPSVEYEELITQKNIELDDGVWYFHIRYFGDNGWSPIEDKRIMIDTNTPDKLEVNVKKDSLEIFSEDELSGISEYEINIPELGQKYTTKENYFDFSGIESGIYSVSVRAYDYAGNYLEKQETISVEAVSSPHFSGIVLGEDEIFVLGYTEDLEGKVYASISNDDFILGDVVPVSDDGKFVYCFKRLKPGLYNLHLVSISEDGTSEKSQKVLLVGQKEFIFGAIAKVLITYSFLILLFILMYACSKKEIKKRKKTKKVKKVKK